MLINHVKYSAEWCFKTREPEEGKEYNEKYDVFRCKNNDNQLYNLLKSTIFTFQTDEVPRESLHMFDTHTQKSMKNLIADVAPKQYDGT